MRWRERLLDNMFLRNMLADFGGRSALSEMHQKFTPYFQYRIGAYQSDYYLYFPKEPFAVRYKNEVFNKLAEYSGYEVSNYLNFHFQAYTNKEDFLRFLLYEVAERLKCLSRKSLCQKLEIARDWCVQMLQEQHVLKASAKEEAPGDLTGDARAAVPSGEENMNEALPHKLNDRLQEIINNAESKMDALTQSFVTGQIELNNHNHLEKLVQVFILLQTVQAPKEIARGEQLFKKFSATDLASLLHLHFEAFRKKRINTLQVNIREAAEGLNPQHSKVKKLSDALQEFFY